MPEPGPSAQSLSAQGLSVQSLSAQLSGTRRRSPAAAGSGSATARCDASTVPPRPPRLPRRRLAEPSADAGGCGSPASPAQPHGHEDLRRVLRHWASGVVAVTGIGPDGAPLGLTVSSFVSVSLTPPLVSFCAAHSSRTWPRLRASGRRVCVTILGERQAATATRFATPGADRFRGIRWLASPGGLPVLEGGLGWLECAVQDEYPAGDHDIVLCRVERMAESGGDGPLLRFRGNYGRLTPGE